MRQSRGRRGALCGTTQALAAAASRLLRPSFDLARTFSFAVVTKVRATKYEEDSAGTRQRAKFTTHQMAWSRPAYTRYVPSTHSLRMRKDGAHGQQSLSGACTPPAVDLRAHGAALKRKLQMQTSAPLQTGEMVEEAPQPSLRRRPAPREAASPRREPRTLPTHDSAIRSVRMLARALETGRECG
jgi:hypothetical protein